MNNYMLLFYVFWFLCGIAAHGLIFGYLLRDNYAPDATERMVLRGLALLSLLGGPVTFFTAMLISDGGRYGFRWWYR